MSFEPAPDSPRYSTATRSAPLLVAALVFPVFALTTTVPVLRREEKDVATVMSLLAVILVELVLVVSGRAEVRATASGIRVLAGVFRIPLFRLPWRAISRVEVAELRAREWGGWGLRWRLGETALLMRGGPAVVFTTTRARTVAVSMPTEASAVEIAEFVSSNIGVEH